MHTGRTLSLLLLVGGFAAPAAALPHLRRGPTAPRTTKQRGTHPARTAAPVRNIDPERTVQIQSALIRAGYLTGTPSGSWDSETQAAMQKLQQDNHWQTKLVPDARAINKLGLGSNSSALEPSLLGSGAESGTPAAAESASTINQ